MVLQHKYPVTQAAETMNIGLSTLQRWLRQYRVKSGGTGRLAASCTNICDRASDVTARVTDKSGVGSRMRYP
ncbi:hypothetical protein D1914_25980 [Salmonella enterica]|nr:hypothetical protein [Salmonella enterica]EBJ3539792.1 hypothetical protein [Salmonella enterica]EBL1740130.1 hypothetical protein [Salmonella enterica]